MMVPGHTTVGLQAQANETSGIECMPEEPSIEAGIDCLSLQGYNYYYKMIENTCTIPPVVFISGAFQCMASWTKFVEFFEKYTTVITVDLPGTGMSDSLPKAYSLDFLATALLHLIDSLDVKSVNIISASYGSPIAYRFAQLHPARVNRMVLAGVMKEIPDHKREEVADTLMPLRAGHMHDFARQVVDGLMCTDTRLEIHRRRVTERLLISQLMRMDDQERSNYEKNTLRLLNHEPLDLTVAPHTPSLVFTGEHDVFTKPEYCREIASALPNSVYTTIKNADHLFHIERFGVTLDLLDRFFFDKPFEGMLDCSAFTFQSSTAWCPEHRHQAAC